MWQVVVCFRNRTSVHKLAATLKHVKDRLNKLQDDIGTKKLLVKLENK